MFGEVSNSLGLALAHRDVAQDCAELKAVSTLPAGEAGLDRKHFAISWAAFQTQQPARRQVWRGSGGKFGPVRIAGAKSRQRPADQSPRQIAQRSRPRRVPER